MDVVWLVRDAYERARERVMQRDGLVQRQTEARLNARQPIDPAIARADYRERWRSRRLAARRRRCVVDPYAGREIVEYAKSRSPNYFAHAPRLPGRPAINDDSSTG